GPVRAIVPDRPPEKRVGRRVQPTAAMTREVSTRQRRRARTTTGASVAPVEVGALLAIEPGLLSLALEPVTGPLERDCGMLAGLLLLPARRLLGLEQRMVLERVGRDVVIQRHRPVKLGVPALQRQVLLDNGCEERARLLHSTSQLLL